MSYLDVQVLRRFARKLAAVNVPDAVTPEGNAEVKKMFAGGAAPKADLQDEAMMTARDPARVGPIMRDAAKSVGQKATSGMGAAAKYLPDLQTLGYGAGGAAIGGMGAMGLANMLRSKDDDEENNGTPWLSGIGGAVAGGAAGVYLPQIIAALTGKKAPEQAGGAAQMAENMPHSNVDVNAMTNPRA